MDPSSCRTARRTVRFRSRPTFVAVAFEEVAARRGVFAPADVAPRRRSSPAGERITAPATGQPGDDRRRRAGNLLMSRRSRRDVLLIMAEQHREPGNNPRVSIGRRRADHPRRGRQLHTRAGCSCHRCQQCGHGAEHPRPPERGHPCRGYPDADARRVLVDSRGSIEASVSITSCDRVHFPRKGTPSAHSRRGVLGARREGQPPRPVAHDPSVTAASRG